MIYRKIENRGHLGARLYGISVSHGDYIAFVDSDDTVSMNYHRPMLDAAKREDADIVFGAWAFRTERTRRVCTEDSTIKGRLCAEGDETLMLFTESHGREHSRYVLWNKLYKRSLLAKCKSELKALGLDEVRLTYSEDVLVNFFCFKFAARVRSVFSGFYFYRIHSEQSVTTTSRDTLKMQIDSMNFTFNIIRENIGENLFKEKILKNVELWSRLMARTHYTVARALGFDDLSDYIKKKYGVKENRRSTLCDGAAYIKSELLGENFREIDRALAEIYLTDRPTTVRYERRSKYISAIIADMPKDVAYSKSGEFNVSKRRIRLTDRLIHNPLLYRIGLILFKKGSRARTFLKKHL